MDNPRLKFARAATGIAFAFAFGAFCLDVFSHIGTVEIATVGVVGVGWGRGRGGMGSMRPTQYRHYLYVQDTEGIQVHDGSPSSLAWSPRSYLWAHPLYADCYELTGRQAPRLAGGSGKCPFSYRVGAFRRPAFGTTGTRRKRAVGAWPQRPSGQLAWLSAGRAGGLPGVRTWMLTRAWGRGGGPCPVAIPYLAVQNAPQ